MIEIFGNIQGAIFDLDGTILDTMEKWHNVPLEFLKQHNINADENLGRVIFPMTIEQAAEYIREKYNLKDDKYTIIKGVNSLMKKYYETEAKPKSGMIELLETLKSFGVKMTLATATDREIFMPAVKRLSLDRYFTNMYTCTEIGKPKSFPDIFFKASDYMSTLPDSTWVFEDGLYSAETAKKSGFKIAGIYDSISSADWNTLKNISDVIRDENGVFRKVKDMGV